MRIVYGAHFKDQTEVIFQDSHIFKFGDLVKLKTCEVMYRAVTVCEPNCLINMRKKDVVQKYTRTNLKAMSVIMLGAIL